MLSLCDDDLLSLGDSNEQVNALLPEATLPPLHRAQGARQETGEGAPPRAGISAASRELRPRAGRGRCCHWGPSRALSSSETRRGGVAPRSSMGAAGLRRASRRGTREGERQLKAGGLRKERVSQESGTGRLRPQNPARVAAIVGGGTVSVHSAFCRCNKG